MLELASLQVRIMNEHFSICQVSDAKDIPFDDVYVFVAKTDDELSLVCRTKVVPDTTIQRADGYRAFRVVGVLPLDKIGIISRIASILMESGISIFVISTYNTDYILVQESDLDEAQKKLRECGYDVITGDLFPHWYNPEDNQLDNDNTEGTEEPRRKNGFLKE